MVDPIAASLKIASSGIDAQSRRLRVLAENIANADSTADVAGGDPYRRKTISFESAMDRASGVRMVKMRRIGEDESDFRLSYDPAHPAADPKGVVKRPNVDVLVELADMKEANRSYQAALQVYRQSRELFSATLELLKG